MQMDSPRIIDATAPTRTTTATAGGRPTSADARFACLAAACGVAAAGRGDAGSATVLLGRGPAGAALAPERLAWLEGRFHVYLEVLDRGSAETAACLRITRPPDAGPDATRFAAAAGRLLAWLARHGRRAADHRATPARDHPGR
jgi:hypothetical protein